LISPRYQGEKISTFRASKHTYLTGIGYNIAMPSTPESLPTDPQKLRALCARLQVQVAVKNQVIELHAEQLQTLGTEHTKQLQSLEAMHVKALQIKQDTIEYLMEQLALLRSKRYQGQSEQLRALQGQLFDEAELDAAIREAEEKLAELQREPGIATEHQPASPKQRPKRKPLPEHLKRVDILVDVSDADKQMMGDDWTLVGQEISEQLAVQQRTYYVKRFKRAKYVRNQASDDETGGIKVAPRPIVILPKAIADSSLLADVMVGKFVDALSFYRTERILQRDGIDIGYSTLCDWPIQLTERLAPLQPLLQAYASGSDLWHLDETTLQVLREPDREPKNKSYLWGMRAGPPDRPVLLFHYAPRRNYEALRNWLAPCLDGFTGVIVSDEHKPYNRLVQEHPAIAGHGGCMAHCRRKFADAAKGRKDNSEAHKVLRQIAILYRLENGLADLNGEKKTAARRDLVAPQLKKIKAYLEQLQPKFPKKGLMQTAIYYALNNWHKFTAFLEHAAMPIDNNPMEQSIRPFTLGRRNWLFSGSPRGATASAFMYSLIETAKANGWEPRAYLNELFERYPHAKTDDERRALLPMFLAKSK
jgi:transposase